MTPPRLLSAALSLVSLVAAAHAATITGTVSDRTTNKVAAHDTVVLIGFGQGMQEIARTTTDAHGRYSIEAPAEAAGGPANGAHLIRVDHQKATYFQPAPAAATTVDVDVYDVAERVQGITTEADVLNMQTDQQGLHVIENYFVKNSSKPAMTQLSRLAYEIYLPKDAKIEATAAMGPGGMPVSSSPIPVDPAKDPGHYAFVFPVRPGETRFQVSYHLPYSGSLGFSAKGALATENLVVMLPKSMQFTPSGSEFQPVPESTTSQTFVMKGVAAGRAVAFTIAGTGQMPREAQGSDQAGQAGEAAGANGQGSPTAAQPESAGAPDTRPGGGLGPPIDTPDPLNKYKWWILSALAILLVAAAGWLLRKPRTSVGNSDPAPKPERAVPAALRPTPGADSSPISDPVPHAVLKSNAAPLHLRNTGFLDALKEALFALESERLAGQTSEQEYLQLKASLDAVLRQVVSRSTLSR